MLTPANPRAAQMAASGLAASARLAFAPDSAARRAMAAATSCGRPNRRSSPEASSVTVSGGGLLHHRRKFEGQRRQIADAVKTGEHGSLRYVEGPGQEAAVMARSGLRRATWMRMPRSSREVPGAPDQSASFARAFQHAARRRFWRWTAAPPTPAPWGYAPPRGAGGTRRSARCGAPWRGGVSPRSMTTRPNPPPWISRSAAFRACSALCPHEPKSGDPAGPRQRRRSADRRHPRHPPGRRFPGARWLPPGWKAAGWCGRKRPAR